VLRTGLHNGSRNHSVPLLRLSNACECLGRITVTLTQSDKGGFADYPLNENGPSNENSPAEWLDATWRVKLIQGRKRTTESVSEFGHECPQTDSGYQLNTCK
jgi:hypothetical protein